MNNNKIFKGEVVKKLKSPMNANKRGFQFFNKFLKNNSTSFFNEFQILRERSLSSNSNKELDDYFEMESKFLY